VRGCFAVLRGVAVIGRQLKQVNIYINNQYEAGIYNGDMKRGGAMLQ